MNTICIDELSIPLLGTNRVAVLSNVEFDADWLWEGDDVSDIYIYTYSPGTRPTRTLLDPKDPLWPQLAKHIEGMPDNEKPDYADFDPAKEWGTHRAIRGRVA